MKSHHTIAEVESVITVMVIKIRHLRSVENNSNVSESDKDNLLDDIKALASKLANDNGA